MDSYIYDVDGKAIGIEFENIPGGTTFLVYNEDTTYNDFFCDDYYEVV